MAGQQDTGAEPSGKHAAGVRCRSRPYGWQPVMRYPPQVIDQPAGGSGAARVHDEIGEQCSLLGTPKQEVPPAVNDLDRPEHTALQEAASPAPAAR